LEVTDVTLVVSFRNRPDCVSTVLRTAFETSPLQKAIFVDGNSDIEVINRLREEARKYPGVRIVESHYRTSLVEAWNIGLMLSDTRYVIFASSDVVFHSPGWLEALMETTDRGAQYTLLENHAVFLFDRALLGSVGWFDERFVNGPHFDCDYLIRLDEAKKRFFMVGNSYYKHGDRPEETIQRVTGDVPDRLPMNDLANERFFKKKWKSSWPGWEGCTSSDLPHPPIYKDGVERAFPESCANRPLDSNLECLVGEIDPHPMYSRRVRERWKS
jgi:glycosyltransferase involved in cell wall biosynthesis